jgi:hypothetical protein
MDTILQEIDWHEWVKLGIDKGWIGPPCCYSHDALPTTAEEDDEFFEGGDPCIHILRLYDNEEHRALVEENHSPSEWRKFPYKGDTV